MSRDEVCERIQVGTRIQEARPEVVQPATEAREVPVYEWRCSSVLRLRKPDVGGRRNPLSRTRSRRAMQLEAANDDILLTQ